MPASQPTIIATSIGIGPGSRGEDDWVAGPSYQLAAELSGRAEASRICLIATAAGDNPATLTNLYSAFGRRGMVVSHLALFPSPNIADLRAHLLGQDIIWVSGGSTPNLLALWRLHGLDLIMRECWEAGVVLMGCSAGSVCWHLGGTTDGFGLPLRPVTDGLGFLPYSNSPHYDAEPERRPKFQELIGSKALPDGYATDDGVGLIFRGTEFSEAISELPDKNAFKVSWSAPGEVTEEPITPRLLTASRPS
ncbi:MAG: Type 1 glutamine amidotransferase-like domain-containing protein [Candidatus Dormibacteria bacterium]